MNNCIIATNNNNNRLYIYINKYAWMHGNKNAISSKYYFDQTFFSLN